MYVDTCFFLFQLGAVPRYHSFCDPSAAFQAQSWLASTKLKPHGLSSTRRTQHAEQECPFLIGAFTPSKKYESQLRRFVDSQSTVRKHTNYSKPPNNFGKIEAPVTGITSIIIYPLQKRGNNQAPLFSSTNQWLLLFLSFLDLPIRLDDHVHGGATFGP